MNKGLYIKYEVRKTENNKLVEGCFVLRPDKDEAAVEALRAYASATKNTELANDIYNWVGIGEDTGLSPDEIKQLQANHDKLYAEYEKQHELLDQYELNCIDVIIQMKNDEIKQLRARLDNSVELPCNINNKEANIVYEIIKETRYNDAYVKDIYVTHFIVTKDGVYTTSSEYVNDWIKFGEEVFATKAEAEQTLKNLEVK